MNYERMVDDKHQPTEKEILKTIGQTAAWLDLRQYIEENYNFAPELVFYGKKYGWTIRYRKSGKTLCSLFPENGAFTALVVLGGKEVEKTFSILDRLSPDVRLLFENAKQLRDGRWLWIRVLTNSDVESVKLLLNVKRKPKKSITDSIGHQAS